MPPLYTSADECRNALITIGQTVYQRDHRVTQRLLAAELHITTEGLRYHLKRHKLHWEELLPAMKS